MADNIKAPSHYVEGREYEPKDVIRDWGLNFNLGSAVKYISRAGRKGDKLEDLRKARQFLEFEIAASAEEEDLKRIVKKIDNDELTVYNISNDLYCGYQDIRDAIARQALRKVGEKEKSDIGMTCKEAAAIGDAIAKGFEEAVEKEISKEENEKRISAELLSRAVTRSENPMRFEDVPKSLKPFVVITVGNEVLDGMCDLEGNVSSDELRKEIINYIIENLDNGKLTLFELPFSLFDYSPEIREWANNLISKGVKYEKMQRDTAVAPEERKVEDTFIISFKVEED